MIRAGERMWPRSEWTEAIWQEWEAGQPPPWEPGVEDDDAPDASDLAAERLAMRRWEESYALGRIRPVAVFTAGVTLCEQRPEPRLSQCILAAEHAGPCVAARLTKRGVEFFHVVDGVQPKGIVRVRLAYLGPTRVELAEEWAASAALCGDAWPPPRDIEHPF